MNLEVAEAESRLALEEIRNDSLYADDDWQGWQLEITDASHRVLRTIPLDQSRQDYRTEELWLIAKKRVT
nr:hypothetical protein [Microvirga zambiensis]